MRSLDSVDLQGITPGGTLDYSQVGEPSGRASVIAQPDDVPGGLSTVSEVESDLAKEYAVPGA